MQQVAVGRLVDRGGVEMVLDRGKLAKIDRRVFAELDHGEGPQMVKVPLSDAAWSTWRRYCEVLGLTMGEGIAGLIDVELTAVVDDNGADAGSAVFAIQATKRLVTREAQVAARELEAEAVEERQRAWSERLRRWEGELEAREVRAEQAGKSALRNSDVSLKVGRNERCPCGSGLKYKHCHGLS
jgi:hypothetical protein